MAQANDFNSRGAIRHEQVTEIGMLEGRASNLSFTDIDG